MLKPTINADDRARTGHLVELLLQRDRVVGQGFDLLARERGAE
jgi:hypothetical protein